MTYEFDTKLNTTNYEIGIDRAATYGYFKHKTLGDERGGSLRFEFQPDTIATLELTDYDGTACLPKEVATALQQAGFVVGTDFD